MSSRRPLRRVVERLSWPWRIGVGVGAGVLGLLLLTNPIESLTGLALYLGASFVVLGLLELARPGPPSAQSRLQTITAVAWIALGVVVLVVPGHLITALPVVIGVWLLVAGVLRCWSARRGAPDERLSDLFVGLTQVVLGIVTLTWGDLTLVVAAVLFGVFLVVSGVGLAAEAVVRRDRTEATASQPEGRVRPVWQRWGRVVAAGLALAVAVTVLSVSRGLDAGAPTVDDFYTAPAEVPAQPGSLLRAEPFSTEVPSGASAQRILYTTTDVAGEPTVASGIVVIPDGATGPVPVIAWAHGTTGYARQCAPSLLKQPFTAGAFPAVMDQVVARGWVVVATDYAGLGTAGPQPYLIGAGEARSVLDAVRAARQLKGVDLDADRTVVWGHSQGGGAALWTNQLQPTYAPDVPLRGTVAMAPASDPAALARNLPNVAGGSVFGSFVAQAYADTYPDLGLGDFIRPGAVPFVERLASRCLSEPGVLKSVLTALSLGDRPIFREDAESGEFGERLRANVPDDPGPGPLLVAQGLSDSLVVPQVTSAYVAGLRADGHRVEFKTYPGLDHMPLVQAGSALLPELLAWTEGRLKAGS